MNKEQVKVFNELLNDEGFKGKEMLKRLLWVNTNDPKFKSGDCFRVSDPGHTVFGQPVRNFKAKVVKVMWQKIGNLTYRYELEMNVRYKGKQVNSLVYLDESYLTVCARCEDNVNELDDGNDDSPEEILI